MDYNMGKVTSAELSALMASSAFDDHQMNVRNAQYKIAAALTRSRERTGFSDADIMEGLAKGCDATDVSFYTYTALEYIMRYTTRYGAAVVIVAGIFQVLQTAAAAGSKLFGMIFQTKQDAATCIYKKDAAAVTNWMTSGVAPSALIGSLLATFRMFLPPTLLAAVDLAGPGAQQVGSARPASTVAPGLINNSRPGEQNAGPSFAETVGGAIGAVVPGMTKEQGTLLGGLYELLNRDEVVRDRTVRDGSGAKNLRVARRRI